MIDEMPSTEARESLLEIERYAVGSGNLKPADSKRKISDLRRAADPPRTEEKQSSNITMADYQGLVASGIVEIENA